MVVFNCQPTPKTIQQTLEQQYVLITAIVRAKAAADIFRPSSAIIEEVLLDQMTDGPCSSLPQPDYVAEAASRKHQQLRLKDPLDLDFKLEESPDGFFHLELKVHGRHHLIFSSSWPKHFIFLRYQNWVYRVPTAMTEIHSNS